MSSTSTPLDTNTPATSTPKLGLTEDTTPLNTNTLALTEDTNGATSHTEGNTTHAAVTATVQGNDAPKRRPSGIPIARRAPSLHNLTPRASSGSGWRTRAAAPTPAQASICVSSVHAEGALDSTKESATSGSGSGQMSSKGVSTQASIGLAAVHAVASTMEIAKDSHETTTSTGGTSPNKGQHTLTLPMPRTRRRSSASSGTSVAVGPAPSLTTPATATIGTSTRIARVVPTALPRAEATLSAAAAAANTSATSISTSTSASVSPRQSKMWFGSLTKGKGRDMTAAMDVRTPAEGDTGLVIDARKAEVPVVQVQPPTPAIAQGPMGPHGLTMETIGEGLTDELPEVQILSASPPPRPSVPTLASAVLSSSTSASVSASVASYVGSPAFPSLIASSPPLITDDALLTDSPPASAVGDTEVDPPIPPPIPIPAPKPKRSWFGSRPATPTRPASPHPRAATSPSSSSPSPSPSPMTMKITPEPTSSLAGARERPKTPPPGYPLELQLDVDTVVDRDAMRAPALLEDASAEEPPGYIASERGRGMGLGVVVGGGKGKAKKAGSDSANAATNETPMGTGEEAIKGIVGSVATASSTESADVTTTSPTTGSGFVLTIPLLGRTKVPLGILGERRDTSPARGASTPTTNSTSSATIPTASSSIETTATVSPVPMRESVSDPGVQRGKGGEADGKEEVKEDGEHVSGNGKEHAIPPLPVPRTSWPPSQPTSAASDAPSLPSPAEMQREASSWWGYVGWSAGAMATDKSGSSVTPSSDNDVIDSGVGGESAGGGDEAEGIQEEGGTGKDEEVDVEVTVATTADGGAVAILQETTKQEGIATADTAASGAQEVVLQGPTWYTPWAWYSPAVSKAASPTASEHAGRGDIAAQKAEEVVKEGEVAVEIQGEVGSVADPVAPSPPPSPAPAAPAAPTNSRPTSPSASQFWAAEGTITASLTQFAAFISARSRVNLLTAGGRAIQSAPGVERDSHGNEVMHLDFDEDEDGGERAEDDDRGRLLAAAIWGPNKGTARVSRSASAGAGRRQTPGGTPGRVIKEGWTDTMTSSTGTGTSEATTETTAAAESSGGTPPGSTSTSKILAAIGTTASKTAPSSRAPSPSPAPPAYPKKAPTAAPNLVLPTWADTFFVAPRSVLPPRPRPPPPAPVHVEGVKEGGEKRKTEEGVLGRTMRFVGNVLFAGPPSPSTSASPSSQAIASTSKSAQKTEARRKRGASGPHPSSRLARVASASSGVSMRLASDSESVSSEFNGEDAEHPDAGGLDGPGHGEEETDAQKAEAVLARHRRAAFRRWGQELPKAWRVLEEGGFASPSPLDAPSSPSPAYPRPLSPVRGSRPSGGRHGSWVGNSGEGAVRLDVPPSEEAGEDRGSSRVKDVLRGCRRVVVIGIHGWFPGAMIRTVLGEPTGTSTKFANMTEQALHAFEAEHGARLEKITKIPLEGDGTIEKRVEKLHATLLANPDWVADLHDADAVFVATHSQGSVVSTHLIARLIEEGHIVTSLSLAQAAKTSDVGSGTVAGIAQMTMGMSEGGVGGGVGAAAGGTGAGEGGKEEGKNKRRTPQHLCLLALCGIHLGPLRYLSSSTLVGPYLQYFESTAARELFEFQNTESAVSRAYVAALERVLDHGTKVVYVASLNDQVVPIYSGLFTAVSHPLILRALYIDGDAYHSSDFLSNLLVLLLRIRNAGIGDSGLLAHLSEATAGSLNGVGHSSAYEELATYSLAVKYLFLTNDGEVDREKHKMVLEPFNATHEQNDYEIPWSLRDIIANPHIAHFFGRDIAALRDAFREWHPKTTILRDLKRKLQPITRLPGGFVPGYGALAAGGSKL